MGLRPLALRGIGVDAASASRIAALLDRRPQFAERSYTPEERQRCAGHPERWAGRWAVKEAIRKLAGAAGARPLPAHSAIETVSRPNRCPAVCIHGATHPVVELSITHEGDLAIAVAVVLEGGAHSAPALAPPEGLRLPERPRDGNKGTFGTAVVLAGAHGFSGAAFLSATGAARGGAGLVRLCVPRQLFPILATKCTEVMVHPLPDAGRGLVTMEGVTVLRRDHLQRATVLVVGPGIGRDPATEAALLSLIQDGLPCPVVVDADGLNIGAAHRIDWSRAGQPVVLTPHPAEMGRLAAIDTATVQADRERVAAAYAREHGVVVVLKGAQTIVAAADGRLHRDGHRGIVALATGGTGDVLSGLIGAMIATGLPGFEAAVAAVTIHSEAGVALETARGRAGALAGDLLEELPAAQERVRRAVEARASW